MPTFRGPIPRRVFALTSVTLTALVGTVWALSGWWIASVWWGSGRSIHTLELKAGRLIIFRNEDDDKVNMAAEWRIERRKALQKESVAELLMDTCTPVPETVRYYWGWDHFVFRGRQTAVSMTMVPIWPVPVIASVPLAFMAGGRVLSHFRARRGLCPSCGYDRRGLATPTDKCPECGSGA